MQIFVELGHHFARAQAFAVGQQLFDQPRGGAHQRQILLDHWLQVRPQHFHRHRLAAKQPRTVHLRHRSRRHRLGFKLGIDFFHRPTERCLNLLPRQIRIKWRHFVLQSAQFQRIGRRQQIRPGGKHLTELHKNRPQALQSQAQAYRQRRIAHFA